MAEIFRPTFGKKGEDVQEVPSEQLAEPILSDAEYTEQHGDLIARVVQIESDYADFLESLEQGAVDTANVELRRQGLKSMSLQQLCNIWLTSRETDWKMKPSFYAAMVIERYLRSKALEEES